MQTPNSKTSSPGWKFLRRSLITVVAFVTLIGLFYAEEDLRGRLAWSSYQREAAAQGLGLDRHVYEPAPVPEDENFAMTPFLASLLDQNPDPLKPGQSRWRDPAAHDRAVKFGEDFSKALLSPKARGFFHEGRSGDLPAMAVALRSVSKSTSTTEPASRTEAAYEILRELDAYRPVMDELRGVARRPYSRYNVLYNQENPIEILLPHLAELKRIAQMFSIRASAELALGEGDAAFEDTKMILVLADSLRSEPIMISHLVRLADLAIAERVIWEGLGAHAWSDAQLKELQTRLEQISVMKDAQAPILWERASNGTVVFDLLRGSKGKSALESLNGGPKMGALFSLAPSGWSYLEQVSYNRLCAEQMQGVYDPKADVVHPEIMKRNYDQMVAELKGGLSSALIHHRIFAGLMIPAFAKYFNRSAFGQMAVQEAALACALERYRIAKGNYPDTLGELVPKFVTELPHDIINGEPLKYRIADNGQFVLYSVGWNQKDDNGEFTLTKDGSNRDFEQGDWGWPAYQR